MTNNKRTKIHKRRRNSTSRNSQDFTNNIDKPLSSDTNNAQPKPSHGRKVSFDLSHNTVHILPSNKQLKLMIQERERQERARATADMTGASTSEDDEIDSEDKAHTPELDFCRDSKDEMEMPSDTNSEDSSGEAEEQAPTELIQGESSASATLSGLDAQLTKKKRKREKKSSAKKNSNVHAVKIADKSEVQLSETGVSPDAAMTEAEAINITTTKDKELDLINEAGTDSGFLESVAFADAIGNVGSPVVDVDEVYYREKYFPNDLLRAIAEENNAEDAWSEGSVEVTAVNDSDDEGVNFFQASTSPYPVDNVFDTPHPLMESASTPPTDFDQYSADHTYNFDDGSSSAGSSPYSLLDEDELDNLQELGSLAIITADDDKTACHRGGLIKGWVVANANSARSKMDADDDGESQQVAPWARATEGLIQGDVH
ncbi:hypothetical protein BC938DRAFT_470790 [Jimgerdemannia flammicorona]|uniref:Uncharacterized protein n=1 Tax=Jimgerdemannia flammicorona TaxID=994334 RepID=A0A433Q9M0_9FUNG|nr:hypothetical protein BC938DRAFT_470790 [Jimgerdemannia flammicorona]